MQHDAFFCPTCGAPHDMTAERDGVVVQVEPLRVSFRGSWIELSPLQAEIMAKLVRVGCASTAALQSDGGAESLRVTIHRMRKRLPDAVQVDAIYGWGYALRVERVEARAEAG